MEGARLIGLDTRVDYSATVDELGAIGRSLAGSMRDTVRWLADARHISPRAAGSALRLNDANRPCRESCPVSALPDRADPRPPSDTAVRSTFWAVSIHPDVWDVVTGRPAGLE